MEVPTPDSEPTPRNQRHVLRRVWLGGVVFLLVAPVAIWVVADLTGKRAWREIEARLREHGEPTSIADLDLPTREQVPDEDNFCALPWFRSAPAGKPSDARLKMEDRLRPFSKLGHDLASHGLNSDPLAGQPIDLEAWAEFLADEASKEDELAEPQKTGPPARRVLAHLDSFSDLWSSLEGKSGCRHSCMLPLRSERAETGSYSRAVGFEHGMFCIKLCSALRLRANAALESGDIQTAVQSLDHVVRLAEGCANDQGMLGLIASAALTGLATDIVAEALWSGPLKSDPDALLRFQRALERVDLRRELQRSYRAEATFVIDVALELAADFSERRSSGFEAVVGKAKGGFFAFAPQGSVRNSAAHLADLMDRHFYSVFRRDGDFGEIMAGARAMQRELDSMSRVAQLFHGWIGMAEGAFPVLAPKLVPTEAYRRQGIVACALQRYRGMNGGELPLELSALVPEFLVEVPADPVDGQPLRYVRTGGGGYRLWSIGFDAEDDEGAVGEGAGGGDLRSPDYFGDWPWPVVPRPLPDRRDDSN